MRGVSGEIKDRVEERNAHKEKSEMCTCWFGLDEAQSVFPHS